MSTHSGQPRIRFAEFQKSPGWKVTPLSEVLFEHGHKSDGKSAVHSVSVHKGVVDQVEHLGRSYAAADISNYNLVLPGDIVYTKSPTGDFPFGIIKRSNLRIPAVVSPLYGVFTPESEYIGIILDAYFESHIRAIQYLAPITQKGAKNTIQISNAAFLSKGIYLPSDRLEQQRLAECISSLSLLIEVEAQMLVALRQRKKGLLQQLLPRSMRTDDETATTAEQVPRLRFTDFMHAPHWVSSPLSEHLYEHRTKNDGASEVHSVAVNAGIVNQIKHLGRNYSADDTSHYNLVFPSDLVYTKSPTGQFPFGIVKQSRLEHNAVVSPLYGVFSPNRHSIGYLIEAFFESPNRATEFLAPISKKGAKNTIQISNTTFLSGEMLFPSTPEEADSVADCLSSFDVLITAQGKRLELIRSHKRGLLARLFPPIEDLG